MILEVRGDRVIVLLDPVQEEKYGTIFMPDKHSVPSRFGTVIGCGPEAKQYQIGERIVVGYWAGIATELPKYKVIGDVLRIVKEGEILAVVKNEGIMELEGVEKLGG